MNVIDNRECGVAEDDQVVGMKVGWQMKRLVDVATLQRGFDLPTQERTSGFVPLVTSSGITDTVHKSAVQGPGVATGRSGSIGKVFYIDQDFWPLNTVLYVKDFHGNDPRFIFYLLSNFDLNRFATGTGVPTLNRNFVHDEIVNVPSLPEQQRIVALLDEAFAGLASAKANAEQNLQNARAIFESHLQSVFSERGEGWEEKKVSDIAKHFLGKMLDKAKNRGELQPYLRNINVRWLTFDLSDLLEMPFLPTEAEKYTAVKGDVLICEGGYPGRAAIWNEDFPIYFQKALHRVRFHEPELNKWFVYFLILQDSSGQLMQYFSGTGIQHFTGEALARFKIPVPPLAEMRKCVARFEALSAETQHLTRLYERKLAVLEELKKSLLHQAFNGEL